MKPETVNINGVPHHVIDERAGLIQVHRPNGVKLYWAKRLPDSPLYGENRARLVPSPVSGSVRQAGAQNCDREENEVSESRRGDK